MHIVVVGLNYRSAPVEIREKFAFEQARLPEALQQLGQMKCMLESVIVSTCNRTELYMVVDREHVCTHYIHGFLERWFDVPRAQFAKHLYTHEREKAMEHLFRVACGLDSMIIGETQILGQVRDAFLLAQREKMTGTMFNMLFKMAITTAKRAHAETSVGENPVSVSYAAVELGRRIFGSFEGKTVLLVGAGKMSELTAKHLHSGGTSRVLVANRTTVRAEELAGKFGGKAIPYERLLEGVAEADIVISSTGATEYVLKKEQVASALQKRKSRPLFMIDIAVPRDIEPGISELSNVFLYDIDDLETIVAGNLEQRRSEAVVIESMIDAELASFAQWVKTLGVSPVIQALQAKSALIHEETMDSLLNKLPDLDERQVKVIRKLTKSIVNQMLRDPILRIKELSAERRGDEAIEMFTKLFALEDALAEQKALEAQLEQTRKRVAELRKQTEAAGSDAVAFGSRSGELLAGS
ncbi:MAG: glutamyl-tRNA reductase [Paenibacillaceae bacterium]|nr:glutamyl-tRNA reductase [Paenibacillaceae bacterium]